MEVIMHLYLRFLMHIETANFYLLQKTVILSISASVLSRNEWQKMFTKFVQKFGFPSINRTYMINSSGKESKFTKSSYITQQI